MNREIDRLRQENSVLRARLVTEESRADAAVQAERRAIRDALREIHDSHDPELEWDEMVAINDHILALFREGGRFEIAEGGEGE